MLMWIWTITLYGFAALGLVTALAFGGMWMVAVAYAKAETDR